MPTVPIDLWVFLVGDRGEGPAASLIVGASASIAQ